MEQESNQKSTSVPFYTKVGWVGAWIVMAILTTMILRNCVLSVKYGSQTETSTVESYYQSGIKDGKLGNDFYLPADVMKNPVLRKSYTKGFREGMDIKNLPQS